MHRFEKNLCDRQFVSITLTHQHLMSGFFCAQFESESEGESEPAANGSADSEIEMAASPELSEPPTPPPVLPAYYPGLQVTSHSRGRLG